jgi:phage replication initiation protein
MQPVIVDYLSFTFCPMELRSLANLAKISDGDTTLNFKRMIAPGLNGFEHSIDTYVDNMVRELTRIIPELESWDRPDGLYNYEHSKSLYRDGHSCGVIAYGCRRVLNTGIYVSLSGLGCAGVDMNKLHELIRILPMVKITRVDLAYDDYRGERPIEWAMAQYEAGGFNAKANITPSYAYYESGSLVEGRMKHSGGRSLYVGKRENGKMLRAYEKAKQLANKGVTCDESIENWVRYELELRSKDRKIPLDIIINTSVYLAGAYPCLEFISELLSMPIKCCKRIELKAVVKNLAESAKSSYGGLIRAFRDVGFTDKEICDRLERKNISRSISQKLAACLPPPKPEKGYSYV